MALGMRCRAPTAGRSQVWIIASFQIDFNMNAIDSTCIHAQVRSAQKLVAAAASGVRPVSSAPRVSRSLVAAPKQDAFTFASRHLARHVACSAGVHSMGHVLTNASTNGQHVAARAL